MSRCANIALFGLTLAFVASGAAFAFSGYTSSPDAAMLSAMGEVVLRITQPAELPLMQLRPDGAYALLVYGLWGLLLLDGAGQIIDPSPEATLTLIGAHAGALAFGTVWPWLILPAPAMAAIGAVTTAAFATVAVFRSRGQLRPAIGFMAGWATMLAAAMLASIIGTWLGLSLQVAIFLAIVGGAAVGAVINLQLGRAAAYPLAVISWLSAMVLTMLGTSTSVTLTAIVAITVMALALVRSVT